MKKSYKRVINSIFLDKDLIVKNQDSKKFNLILSPYFYWSKIEDELPIKRVGEVKKLAPSLFEGMLPEGDFIYQVYKLDEAKYLLIALDKKFILNELIKLNIDKTKINAIYLAQSEFNTISNPIEIDDNSGLISIDGVVEKVSLKYISGYSTPLKTILENMSFSKHKIGIYEFEDNFIDNRSFYAIITILIIIASMNLFEYFVYKSDINKVLIKKEEVLAKYNLPSTTFELESIKSNLNSTQKSQIKLRKKILYLDNFPFKKDEFITRFELKSDNLEVAMKLNEAKRAESVKKYLKKEFKIKKMRMKDDILTVEMRI